MGNPVYFLREGARGLFHAKLMTSVSIVTISVVLFLWGVAAISGITIHSFIYRAAERADVVAYVKDDLAADSAALGALAASLGEMPEVDGVAIVDKAAAWERFSAIYGRDMLNAVEGNPLPLSLEITLKKHFLSNGDAEALRRRMEAAGGVESVRYAGDWLLFLAKFRRVFYSIVAALTAAMIVTLYITISNSIKLTIYARRELIKSMHLVGATRSFISMPFIVEGILQGLVGGCIGMALLYILKAVFSIEPSLRQVTVVWGPPALPALFLLLGVLFGWIGSAASVRKFLS